MKVAHALVVGDRDSATEFACTCGARGSYEAVLRHVASSAAADLSPSLRSQGFPQKVVGEITQGTPSEDYASVSVSVPSEDDDFGGGITKAHYLPNEPKRPAPPAHRDTEGAPSYIEPERTSAPGHHVKPSPEEHSRSGADESQRSIAEAFQDMLRVAYQAGAASAATGESFETWYQREVLR